LSTINAIEKMSDHTKYHIRRTTLLYLGNCDEDLLRSVLFCWLCYIQEMTCCRGDAKCTHE